MIRLVSQQKQRLLFILRGISSLGKSKLSDVIDQALKNDSRARVEKILDHVLKKIGQVTVDHYPGSFLLGPLTINLAEYKHEIKRALEQTSDDLIQEIDLFILGEYGK